jgi:hypothetical protein
MRALIAGAIMLIAPEYSGSIERRLNQRKKVLT